MKPWYKKIHFDGNCSYLLNELIIDEFDGFPHCHPECELIYILSGKGQCLLGDKILNFLPGDLLFLGPNLPHSWKSLEKRANCETKFLVINLNNNILEKYILNCPELYSIGRFINGSHQGIYYEGKICKSIGRKMSKMVGMKNFQGLIELLDILRLLSLSDQYQTQASPGFVGSFSPVTDERINQVFSFLSNNFNQEIHLVDLANITNMTEWAFCRYFKRYTRKTFFTCVGEMRIGYACKLLLETGKNMSQISYESGYNSISNFNKQFKLIKGLSPLKYREQISHF